MAFRLTPDAINDLDEIWLFIAKDDPDAANAVEAEIWGACALLAEEPRMGRLRSDLIGLPVRFWTIPRYPNYIVVYKPDEKPVVILRVIHGMRDIKRILDP